MHANQPYPGKLHQASMHEVENRSWLIDLKATALYILLLSRDLGIIGQRELIFGTIGIPPSLCHS